MRTLQSRRKRYMLWRSQDGLCFYCGADLDPAAMHVDHVRPYAKGGPTRLANLVAACPSCNLRKGAKDAVDIVGLRAALR